VEAPGQLPSLLNPTLGNKRKLCNKPHACVDDRRHAVSTRAAFTDFVNSGVSGGRWTLTRWPRSSMPTLTLVNRRGRCTNDSNGQIKADVERCCACYHLHSEV